MAEHPTSVRIDDALLARLDAIAATLTERAAGVNVGRSRVIRLAIERGADALEVELGLARKPKTRR